jgi:putative FmdB family regulatory protein
MPVYEFRCAKCGNKFAKLCQLGETGENLTCPTCNAPGPKRILSAVVAVGTDGGKGSNCGGCTSSSCAGCK